MEPEKTRNRHSWVKGPLHKPPTNIPPHNDGPYTGQFDGVPGDYSGRRELQKSLPDDEEEKLGMPHGTDVYGSKGQPYGKCTYCRGTVYLLPTMLWCPSCKRQLAIESAPGYNNSTYNQGPTDSKMLDGGIPEDFHKGPTHNELRQNLDQYNGGGAQSNDVRGSKS